MAVAAAVGEADPAAVDEHVVHGVSHDEEAATGEGLRRGRHRTPAVARQRLDCGGAEGPEHLARVPREGLLQRRHVPGGADEPGEIAVVVQALAAERQRACVVGVAPERDRAVRPAVGSREARHRLHARAVRLRDVESERLAVERGQQEELGDQAVVGDRGLEVDTVRVDLARDLVAKDRPGPRQPARRVPSLAEEQASEGEARPVRRAVVAVHVRDLEVPVGEVAVQVERAQEALAEAAVRPGAAAVEYPEEPRPAQDAQGRLHRGGPVDGLGIGVREDPVVAAPPGPPPRSARRRSAGTPAPPASATAAATAPTAP